MEKNEKYYEIVKVARQCFENFGYKATTVEHIMKTANMAKGTFYNFFKTKEELLRYLIEDEVKKLTDFAEETMRIRPLNIDVLYHYFNIAFTYRKQYYLYKKLNLEAKTFGTKEVISALKYLEDTAYEQLKRILNLLRDENIIEDGNIELTAFLILEIYNSLTYEWEEEHIPLTYDEISSTFKQLFHNRLIKL